MTGGASYPRTEIQNVKNTCGKCVHCSMDCAFIVHYGEHRKKLYRGADKSLARPTSRSILFDGEKIPLVLVLLYNNNNNNNNNNNYYYYYYY